MEISNFYKNKKVLVTGHTGFKGSWLTIWLNELGADVVGYALDHKTEKDNYIVSGIKDRCSSYINDIRDYDKLLDILQKEEPEIIFHLAAQPLVRESYNNPRETYETNIMGSVNILEAIRQTTSVKTVVMITSDKCYENKELERAYHEEDDLGGYDPYSSSKASAELVIDAYRRSFLLDRGVGIASVRAGNVIGGGDWSSDRLIPDCIQALIENRDIEIRNPMATRPWQHVFEPLSGYLWLGYLLDKDYEKYSQAWNFGPNSENIINVGKVVDKIIDFWGAGNWVDFSKDKINKKHEATLLSLDINKAANLLRWKPALDIDQALKLTVDWYKNTNINYDFCVKQLEEYIEIANQKNIAWANDLSGVKL